MKKKIIIINGPNLNLLGKREEDIYGKISFDSYLIELKVNFSEWDIEYFQSNHCGEIIDKINSLNTDYHGIALNAGGYTHSSIALADAVKATKIPVVEVHISNIFAREDFRKHSVLAPVVKASVMGMGLVGYKYAVDFLVNI